MDHIDPKTRVLLAIGLWLLASGLAWLLIRRWRERERARQRVWAEDDALAEAASAIDDVESQHFLRRWLFLAGFRSKAAPAAFVVATLAAIGVGTVLAISTIKSGLAAQAIEAASYVQGGVGDLATPVLSAAPWLFLAVCGLVPLVVVN